MSRYESGSPVYYTQAGIAIHRFQHGGFKSAITKRICNHNFTNPHNLRKSQQKSHALLCAGHGFFKFVLVQGSDDFDQLDFKGQVFAGQGMVGVKGDA